MKTLLRIFSIALIAGAALVSCGKITPTGGNEQGGDTSGTETGGGDEPGGNTDPDVPTRVLAVSFDTKSTRTSLYPVSDDWSEPRFDAGDVILVANGNATEPCAVYYRNDVAMIETSLQGVLQAVYPEDAAVVENNRIVGVKVPYEQTGLFADANICMVDEIPIDATKVTFKNQTAIFAVTVPANTDQIEVTSLNVISDELNPWYNDFGYRTDSKAKINNDEESDNYSIIVKPKSGDRWSMNNTSGDEDDLYAGNSVYYVSVLTNSAYYNWQSSNVRLIDLNFDTISKPDGDSGDIVRKMGGFSPQLVIKGMGIEDFFILETCSKYATASSLYVLPYSSLHEYKIVNGLKWATMNVGATSPSASGDYFPWAGVDGHQYSNGNWTNEGNLIPFHTPGDGFALNNSPYYYDNYSKYYDGDGLTSLALWDDAAYMNWGGAWRMPTLSDMGSLGISDPNTQYSYTNGHFELTVDGSTLIFPESGSAEGIDPPSIDDGTDLWLATLDPEDDVYAYYLEIVPQRTTFIICYDVYGEENVSWFRYTGMNVRPVSGVSSVPDDPDDGGLTINPYTDGWDPNSYPSE